MSPCHLRLLGSPALTRADGSPTDPRAVQRHRVALLALLALARARAMPRERLMAYLWPERDTEAARQLLNQAVYQLRRTLGDEALRTVGDDLVLDAERVRVDVHAFDAAVAEGDTERAVALYHGPLLDGFFLDDASEFTHWADGERQRLATAFAAALERCAETAAARGDAARALEHWKTRAALDPLDSRAALRVMEAYEAVGHRAGALRHAAQHRRLLRDELDVDAGPAIADLEARLRQAAARAPDAESSDGEVVATTIDASTSRNSPALRRRASVLALAAAALLALVAWRLWPREARTDRSIVVLPFVAMSADSGADYFGDGLTEEIIARLAAVPGLKVISRTSAMHYKGSDAPLRIIADSLGVAHVLEGGVRTTADRVRITAQLIDARRDAHLWAESFDVETRDALRVQETIAAEVVRVLQVKLGVSDRERLAHRGTVDVAAYQEYLRGRSYWHTRTRVGHARAIDHLQRAVARDSTFADAWAGLALAHLTAWHAGDAVLPAAEVARRITAAAERALALDPRSDQAHVAAAMSHLWQSNWPGAERELRAALELNPGSVQARYSLALLLGGTDRVAEAEAEALRAIELDPFGLVPALTHGWVCRMARRFDCAEESYRRALAQNDAFASAHEQLGVLHAVRGRPDSARAAFARALAQRPGYAPLLADLAWADALAGRRDAARRSLAEALADSSELAEAGASIARAYAALGEADSAFAWLDRADWRWSDRIAWREPSLDPLRGDPRFRALAERVDASLGLR